MVSRSRYIPFDHRAKTEVYKRSSHNDFATSAELKDKKFTGWRHNSLTDTMELWILGEVKRTVTPAMLKSDPQIIEKVQLEYFGVL